MWRFRPKHKTQNPRSHKQENFYLEKEFFPSLPSIITTQYILIKNKQTNQKRHLLIALQLKPMI